MGIVWSPAPGGPSVSGSSTAQGGKGGDWMCCVEGESTFAEVSSSHSSQNSPVSSIATVSPSPNGLSVSPTATGFIVSGTPDLWNIGNGDDAFTNTDGRLTKYMGSQVQNQTFTVTHVMTWNYWVGNSTTNATYTGTFDFTVYNKWVTEYDAVNTGLGR